MNESKSKKAKQFFSEEGRKCICRECGKTMLIKRSLDTHVRATHEGMKYLCRQCEHKATSKSSLERHRSSVHVLIRYPCD